MNARFCLAQKSTDRELGETFANQDDKRIYMFINLGEGAASGPGALGRTHFKSLGK